MPLAEILVRHEVDLLFRGQSHVFRVPVTAPGFDPNTVLADFTERYKARFDIELPEMTAMLVNVRTTVIGRRAPVDLVIFAPAIGGFGAPRAGDRRQVHFNGGWFETASTTSTATCHRSPSGISTETAVLMWPPRWSLKTKSRYS